MDEGGVVALKERLSALGISSTTPGLRGAERFEELQKRLDAASKKNSPKALVERETVIKTDDVGQRKIPVISELSIFELKSRLEILNENTSTPGLNGDNRKAELVRRLTNAICSGKGQDNDISEDSKDSSSPKMIESFASQSKITKPIQAQEELSKNNINNNNNNNDKEQEFENSSNDIIKQYTTTEISDMKKELNRLTNKRSLVIASRLSGASKDTELKELETKNIAVDSEISILRQQKTVSIHTEKSSIYIDNGSIMPIDKLITKLERLKLALKDQ
eukprot:gene8774-18148_t